MFSLPIATMTSSFLEKVPLNASHLFKTKFQSRKDSNLFKVLNYLEILFERAKQTIGIPRLARLGDEIVIRETDRNDVRVLSLDGSGIKGLFTIIVLERIVEEVHHIKGGVRVAPKPYEIFDLIRGTSTGGLLAIMLRRL